MKYEPDSKRDLYCVQGRCSHSELSNNMMMIHYPKRMEKPTALALFSKGLLFSVCDASALSLPPKKGWKELGTIKKELSGYRQFCKSSVFIQCLDQGFRISTGECSVNIIILYPGALHAIIVYSTRIQMKKLRTIFFHFLHLKYGSLWHDFFISLAGNISCSISSFPMLSMWLISDAISLCSIHRKRNPFVVTDHDRKHI